MNIGTLSLHSKTRNMNDGSQSARILNTLQDTYSGSNKGRLLAKALQEFHHWARSFWAGWMKRLFDIFVSGLLLLLLSPLFLLLIVLVKLDRGPAFYSQLRIGRHGREFRFWKFRSMVVNADKLKAALADQNEMEGGVIFKMKNDPRITRIGRIIRRTSLDELPQLWNVFNGDMSLVGPRPPLPEEAEQYNAHERRRLEANQGITCIWQVSGRNEISFSEQVDLDLQYIREESLWNDIKLLLKTIPAVVSGRGAS